MDSLIAAAAECTRAALRTARSAQDPLPPFVELIGRIAALLEDAHAAAPQQQRDLYSRVECRKGCTACCYIPLAVTAVEAIAAAAAVLRDEPAVGRVRSSGAQPSGAERWRRRIPCVLLQEGACTIYAQRPLPCRAYVSLSAAHCDEALASGDSGELLAVPTLDLPHRHAAGLRAGIRAACSAEGLQDAHVELGPALTLLVGDPGRVQQWLAGERVFAAPGGRVSA